MMSVSIAGKKSASLIIMNSPMAMMLAPAMTERRWPRTRSARIPPKMGVKYTSAVYRP